MDSQPASTVTRLSARLYWIFFAIIALAGIGVRHDEIAAWRRTGFDELLYRRYVNLMDGGTQKVAVFKRDGSMGAWELKVEGTGAGAMPSLTSFFLRTQAREDTECELPPTRFLYIYTSWLWKRARFGDAPPLALDELNAESQLTPAQLAQRDRELDADHRDPALVALHDVSRWATILAMIAAGLCATRMFGRGPGLGVLALMAVDPVQLHFSQHAMVDGFFLPIAMLCLWTTWECLREKPHRGWFIAHGFALMLMVLAKENSFFVFCGLALTALVMWRLRAAKISVPLVVASIAGPLLAVFVLAMLAGGFGPFIEVYKTLVAKAQNLPYAQLTGDGPWHRYVLDLLAVSPLVVLLAVGALFVVAPRNRELAFLFVFVAASYLIMCNIRYGMNLRYASIWEMPLRAAALLMVWELCRRFGARQWMVATVAVAALCFIELRQYAKLEAPMEEAENDRYLKDRDLYELVPSDILRKLRIIKG